jgi:hypothetical protein
MTVAATGEAARGKVLLEAQNSTGTIVHNREVHGQMSQLFG